MNYAHYVTTVWPELFPRNGVECGKRFPESVKFDHKISQTGFSQMIRKYDSQWCFAQWSQLSRVVRKGVCHRHLALSRLPPYNKPDSTVMQHHACTGGGSVKPSVPNVC